MRIDKLTKLKRFIVTFEVTPPAGTDVKEMLAEFREIKDKVDAVNITDMPGANLKMSPWAGGLWAMKEGITPIVQYTCRDRNVLALKGDILGLASFGIENMLILGGDSPSTGDHSWATAVYDMDTISLICWISENTNICVGAAVNPGADDINKEIEKMSRKIEAGAKFFQTQAIYEPERFAEFVEKVKHFDVPIIAGIIPLRSEKMAYFMNENIPGINVPLELINRMEGATDKLNCGYEIALEIIEKIRPFCSGVHIMPIKFSKIIPDLLSSII